ncbi:hypothetical protein N9B31_02715 [Mariniblastus sp.]|jgi:hypothetical protein|nr:hypothetical protein [bacterium]MDA7902546.1 hypothetical protein [Mariniblastus sp.]MDA7870565.1 hypothetical protein [bacterium]MDA7925281.1 hypothetical protein [Mariniblastus sp.]MDA7929095.1 hypothetical protein [Mariniblastus sp.]
MTDEVINNLIEIDGDNNSIDSEIALQQILETPGLFQHVTRSDHEGLETVVGYFRIDFEPNCQRHILHVPFSPPFKTIPQVDTNTLGEQEARIRITDRQKFGLRMEIILPQTSDSSQHMIIETIASETTDSK